MTDLELMYLLEEEGYEPSIENLMILKEELAQEANGPELDADGELDNEATEERAARTLAADLNNDDVFGDDEEFAEDVGEVVVESAFDYQLCELLESSGFEPNYNNINIVKESFISISEAGYSYGDLCVILEDNCYEPSIDNVITLHEAIQNGDVYIEEGILYRAGQRLWGGIKKAGVGIASKAKKAGASIAAGAKKAWSKLGDFEHRGDNAELEKRRNERADIDADKAKKHAQIDNDARTSRSNINDKTARKILDDRKADKSRKDAKAMAIDHYVKGKGTQAARSETVKASAGWDTTNQKRGHATDTSSAKKNSTGAGYEYKDRKGKTYIYRRNSKGTRIIRTKK